MLLLTIYFIFTLSIFTNANEYDTLASKRSSSYHFVKPTIVSSTLPPIISDFTSHPASIRVLLQIEDREDLLLNLNLNEDLLNEHFKFFFQATDEYQLTRHTDRIIHCYYHGYVENNLQHSKIALSTCNGFRGSILLHGEYYYLEPILNTHIIYKHDNRLPKRVKTCGTVHLDPFPLIPGNFTQSFTHVKRQAISRFVELYLIMDLTLHQLLGSNFIHSLNYLVHVANEMDLMYKSLSIRIALVGATVWSSTNQISVEDDLSITLDNFLDYIPTLQSQASVIFDNAQFVTGKTHPSTVVGFAPLSTMCLDNSGGVSRDLDLRELDIAATISHEMGHNFGLYHDDVGSRPCYLCPGNECTRIMNKVGIDVIPTEFSQCSIDELDAALDSGIGNCIFNEVPMLVTDPVCGNRFVEPGEECDCGSSIECPTVDPCCQPGLCLLKNGAQCTAGECCDAGCQLSPSDRLCREKRNECDIPEYCTGSTGSCPPDLYHTDGTLCTTAGSSSYCFKGTCNTHRGQCYSLFGTAGVDVGVDVCYSELNNKGDKYGNCGIRHNLDGISTYIACTASNVKCGKIQCSTPADPELQTTGSAELTIVTLNFLGGAQVECIGVNIDVDVDFTDPGLVIQGAKCGPGKICVDQMCVDLYTVSDQVLCPINDLGVPCSGKGTCSNTSVCLCDTGFTGSSCNQLASAMSTHKFSTPLIFILLSFLILFL
ncbi:Disintegrin and metalloproteinase domain-containing protein 33 [Oopsacas minuta]|uniref:Disintegrin and metalloproteinase domain-containing protein 33 n=1 Tax=Oopsacas minuta TaxID=111878 RepID=A0AAV7KL37_9METZ|nr:Disintegrin and metalloproteinase domain-containing protein 33 [Oopsacas minuta]